jgi:hypothetical protein
MSSWIKDYEKRAFCWLLGGFLITILWVIVLGFVNIIVETKSVINCVGWIVPLNFLGFEGYAIWILAKGKWKEMRER